MSRRVLLSHLDRNKPVILPGEPEGDICFLTTKFLESFNYAKIVKLTVTFQRFDSEWKEYIDLDQDETINDKDKLKVVVCPSLSDSSLTEERSEVIASYLHS